MNEKIKVGTTYLDAHTAKDGQIYADTGIKVPINKMVFLVNLQSSLQTLSDVINVCEAFKKMYPKFTLSTDLLINAFAQGCKELSKKVVDEYSDLLPNDTYTYSDIKQANLTIAIAHDTQNIIFLKEVLN